MNDEPIHETQDAPTGEAPTVPPERTTGQPEAPQAGAHEPEPATDDLDRTDDVASLRSEAKKRRLQLREVEAERDALRAREDQRDRQDVERMVAGELADASDIWIVTSLDELRTDGTLDPEKVAAQVADALERKPHWRKPAPTPDLDLHGGARSPVTEPPSFGAAVKRAARSPARRR